MSLQRTLYSHRQPQFMFLKILSEISLWSGEITFFIRLFSCATVGYPLSRWNSNEIVIISHIFSQSRVFPGVVIHQRSDDWWSECLSRGESPYTMVSDSDTNTPRWVSCSFVENPDNDSFGGGDAEDSGGPAGEPRHAAGQRRAVPPHSVLHQRAVRPLAALGL